MNRKIENLYLRHAEKTRNTDNVDYEEEEMDCFSIICEINLNLDTWKQFTSNCLTYLYYLKLK